MKKLRSSSFTDNYRDGVISWMGFQNSENANIRITWPDATIFMGYIFLQVVIEIATCKPLARLLAATYTPTYTWLPERSQNHLSPYQ